MKKEDIKKVVLAYSGGLDTSIIIPWLKENYNNCEVIAVSGDVGQGTELDGLEEKAKATGASKLYVLDLKKDFVENYIFPTLKFGAKYEDYLLGTSFARPCIAKALADIAIKEGADAICHGCTGKGNDQVRFELTLKALCPDMAIIAPWREWDIESRDEEIDYAEAHNIPLKINRETNYSKDKNLWHLSHECVDLEDPVNEDRLGLVKGAHARALAEEDPDLIFRHGLFFVHIDADEADDDLRGPHAEYDEGPAQRGEHEHGLGDGAGRFLRQRDGQPFRRELAQDEGGVGHDGNDDGHGQALRVRRDCRELRELRRERHRQRRAGIHARQNADGGDADLDGGEEIFRIVRDLQRVLRVFISLLDHLPELCLPGAHHGDLRHGADPVENDQDKNNQYLRPYLPAIVHIPDILSFLNETAPSPGRPVFFIIT